MSARNFSVMPVQVWNDDGSPADAKPLERAVRRQGNSLNVGSRCDVEFGATWITRGGREERFPGTWWPCRVLRHEGAIVHVRVDSAPLIRQVRIQEPARCICDEGWVCEDHPDLPAGHGCGGAGMPCTQPHCPQKWNLPE